jgi:alcohol dehydrogenase (cytochrome c)
MRGCATIYNGRLFRQSLDCHVIALDMKTGKQIWKQKFADYKEGYIGVIAPLVANGVVITGNGRRRPHNARVPRRLGS